MTGEGASPRCDGKPFVAVNHLEGHALTARLTDDIAFPYLLLLVSGGHCQLLIVEDVGRYRRLGTTVDDAAGEAFDKGAKLLGLGFPGGPAVEQAARGGRCETVRPAAADAGPCGLRLFFLRPEDGAAPPGDATCGVRLTWRARPQRSRRSAAKRYRRLPRRPHAQRHRAGLRASSADRHVGGSRRRRRQHRDSRVVEHAVLRKPACA